jgi:beta-glucanase (GH16 family)
MSGLVLQTATWNAILAQTTSLARADAIAALLPNGSKIKFYNSSNALIRTVTTGAWTRGAIANGAYTITPGAITDAGTGSGTPTLAIFTNPSDVEIFRCTAGTSSGVLRLQNNITGGDEITVGTFAVGYPTTDVNATYVLIGEEGDEITVLPGSDLRYGESTTVNFIDKTNVSGFFTATNEFFDGDPAFGFDKFVFILRPNLPANQSGQTVTRSSNPARIVDASGNTFTLAQTPAPGQDNDWKVFVNGASFNATSDVDTLLYLTDNSGTKVWYAEGSDWYRWDAPGTANPKINSWAGPFADPRAEPPPVSSPMPVGNDTNWVLTFQDEFNGNGLNSTFWNDAIWYGDDNADGTINYDVNNNGNSLLRIWPALNQSGQFFNRTIDTDGKFYQRYGYFEARIKAPRGEGTFPAFWIFNHVGNARPEIDIFECYGAPPNIGWADDNFNPNNYSVTVWVPPGNPTSPDDRVKYGPFKLTDVESAQRLDTDFHIYGCEWTSTQQKFYFDGRLIRTTNLQLPWDLYVLFDLWYGSAAGTPTVQTTPTGPTNSLAIDYVRVWRRP